MSNGLNGTCKTASNNSFTTDVEYHSYRHHHNPSRRSDEQLESYLSVVEQSLTSNGRNGRVDVEENYLRRSEQQLGDDYEQIAPNRPRLLMWGLTKYRSCFLFFYI